VRRVRARSAAGPARFPVAVVLLVALCATAGCGNDDGRRVRNLDEEPPLAGTATPSAPPAR
jgi:hypothetical protein